MRMSSQTRMMSSQRCLWSVILCVLAGCGQGETAIPVEGKVLVDGQPLTVGTVIFTPDAARGNLSKHEPRGQLDANGFYRATMTKDRAGVPPGWYKVSISAQRLKDPKDPYSFVSLIPTKFANPETSGLALQVVDNAAPGAYDIALSTRKP
jgi:hypothetical protein